MTEVHANPNPIEIRPIAQIVAAHRLDDAEHRTLLITALVEREDLIADMLRDAGQQFGLFPAIVAEVLAEVGLGTPPSTEERLLIHNNFHAQLEVLRRQFGEGQ